MNMTTATRVAAIAVGLSLVSATAFAAPGEGRDRHRGDTAAAADQEKPADRDARDGKNDRGRKHDGKAGPTAKPAVPQAIAPNRRQGQDANNVRRGSRDQANSRRDRNRAAQAKRNRNQAAQNDGRRGRDDYNNRNDRRDRYGDRNDRRHINVQQYRRNFNSPRRYRVENYRWRTGYSYRRYSYGQHLPRNYYGRNFWLTNFLIYGLFAPPEGYIWVRYGPDALLIDQYTGEIVQVRYNMFYS